MDALQLQQAAGRFRGSDPCFLGDASHPRSPSGGSDRACGHPRINSCSGADSCPSSPRLVFCRKAFDIPKFRHSYMRNRLPYSGGTVFSNGLPCQGYLPTTVQEATGQSANLIFPAGAESAPGGCPLCVLLLLASPSAFARFSLALSVSRPSTGRSGRPGAQRHGFLEAYGVGVDVASARSRIGRGSDSEPSGLNSGWAGWPAGQLVPVAPDNS